MSTRSTKELNSLGKTLTKLLRHDANRHGISLSPDGFVPVSKVLQIKNLRTRCGIPLTHYTPDDVVEAVRQDGKQRMFLQGEGPCMEIRATQGHSLDGIDDDLMYQKVSAPEDLPVPGLAIHGTLRKHLGTIKSDGLKPMGRKHVHFATQQVGGSYLTSGIKTSAQALVYLDVGRALDEGLPLYLSTNKVLLCPRTVPPRLFKKIVML